MGDQRPIRPRFARLTAGFRSRAVGWLAALGWAILSAAAADTAVFVTGVSDAGGTTADYRAADASIMGRPEPGDPPPWPFNLGNWGASETLTAGRQQEWVNRTVIRFDIGSLVGKYRSIDGARLVLTLARSDVNNPPDGFPKPLRTVCYRIAPENAGWIEGGGIFGEEVEGGVCWEGPAGAQTDWAGQPGCAQAGVDYLEPAAAAVATSADWYYEGEQWVFEFQDPAGWIGDWIARPEDNAGLLIVSPDLEALAADRIGYLAWHSGDAPDDERRPRLEIDYTPPEGVTWVEERIRPDLPAGQTHPDDGVMATSLRAGSEGVYGGADSIRLGREDDGGLGVVWRGILKFDLDQTGLQYVDITSAEMILTVRETSFPAEGPESVTIDLHRIAPANASWREGTRAEGEAEAGAASWDWLAGGSRRWAGGETLGRGLSAPGVDYIAEPAASATFATAELTPGAVCRMPLTDPRVIMDWVADAGTNGGLRVSAPGLEAPEGGSSDGTAWIDFYSDDAADPDLRPVLALQGWKSWSGAVRESWAAYP